jgi:hypothetical protein
MARALFCAPLTTDTSLQDLPSRMCCNRLPRARGADSDPPAAASDSESPRCSQLRVTRPGRERRRVGGVIHGFSATLGPGRPVGLCVRTGAASGGLPDSERVHWQHYPSLSLSPWPGSQPRQQRRSPICRVRSVPCARSYYPQWEPLGRCGPGRPGQCWPARGGGGRRAGVGITSPA